MYYIKKTDNKEVKKKCSNPKLILLVNAHFKQL